MHVDFVVVPERHDEDHALGEGVTHGLRFVSQWIFWLRCLGGATTYLHTTLLGEVVGVSEHGLLRLAEVVVDRVAADACDVRGGLLEDLAVLDVETADLNKVTAGGVVGGDELGLRDVSVDFDHL